MASVLCTSSESSTCCEFNVLMEISREEMCGVVVNVVWVGRTVFM
jgi:hypothetical protein